MFSSLLLLAAFAAVVAGPLLNLSHYWNHNPLYGFGWFVLVLGGILAVQRLDRLPRYHPDNTPGLSPLILLLLVYVSVLTPLQIAFFEQDFANLPDWMGWFVMDLIVDAVFIADIVLNFRTAWMSKEPDDYGRYVFNARDAARRYCKGWFTVDLLSVVPFYLVDVYLLYADVPASTASSITRNSGTIDTSSNDQNISIKVVIWHSLYSYLSRSE